MADESQNPRTTDVDRLKKLIQAVAANEISGQDFVLNFRKVHEQIENEGRPRYGSKEEAQLIWDVLWALEFYESSTPQTLKGLEEVVQVAKRSAEKLKDLAA